MSPTLDVTAVRAQFPAITRNPDFVFCENAGGSQVLGTVADGVRDFLLETSIQLAAYPLAQRATAAVQDGTAAAAVYAGAESPNNIMTAASTTQAVENLSRMIEGTIIRQRRGLYAGSEPTWAEGDEIIVSQADHEANRGAWLRLAERQKLVVKEWPVTPIAGQSGANPYAMELNVAALEPLLGPRTRLVAFTACSNVLGSLTPIAQAAATVKRKAPQAYTLVDAVAFAPHKRVAPRTWGVDMVTWSWYKVYGPHMASMYISPRVRGAVGAPADEDEKDRFIYGKVRSAAALLSKNNHHFLHQVESMYSFQPSSQQYELVTSIRDIVDYLRWIGQSSETPAPTRVDYTALYPDAGGAGYASASGPASSAAGEPKLAALQAELDVSYKAIREQERLLLAEIMGFLTSEPMRARGVRIIGNESADPDVRAPTVSFVLVDTAAPAAHANAHRGEKLHKVLLERFGDSIGVQQGNMYAYALVVNPPLSIIEADGVIRVSFVHYNTVEEVRRVTRVIEEAISTV